MKHCCDSPKPLIYRTRRTLHWTVRYRRCQRCGQTSKTVAVGFTDQRVWFDCESLLDDRDFHSDDAIIGCVESVIRRAGS